MIASRVPRRRTGQATVELALMLPVVFMLLFVCVELAFYFGNTHYTNYAAFIAARAQQGGQDAQDAAKLLLDGNTTRNGRVRPSASNGSVTISQRWRMDMPFLRTFGDLDYDVTVVAGIDEEKYEGRGGGNGSRYGDNQCRGRC